MAVCDRATAGGGDGMTDIPRSELEAAVTRAERAEAGLRCPVCAGTGAPDCACGGSGSIRDAYDWVVKELDAAHADYDRLIAAGWSTQGEADPGRVLLLVDGWVEPGYVDDDGRWLLWDNTPVTPAAWKRWPEVPKVADY